MTRSVISLAAVVLTLLVFGCNEKPASLSPEKYFHWIGNEENGLVKAKTIKEVTIKARLLPADLLAYNEFQNSDAANFDSLRNSYKCGLTFQVIVQADKANREYGNLLYYDVAGQDELAARVRALSFNISDFVSLKHGDKVYLPVLSQYEGFDAIGNKISFQLVFSIDEYKCGASENTMGDVTLVFEDPFWNLGVNNFLFEKGDYESLPTIRI